MAKMIEYRDRGNYLLHDFTLMPNHLHLILTPADTVKLEKVMQLIKGGSSFAIHKMRGTKMEIWQPGFHESRVPDWLDYKKKADYTRFNPVAGKLVKTLEAWPYGSASGNYELDPVPQGLKPPYFQPPNVGPEGPTPKGMESGISSFGFAAGRKADA
jgi:putative transposase